MQRPGGLYSAAPMEAEPVAYYDPEPEPEQEPQPNPEQSHSHVDSHSYHPDLAGRDYIPSFSGGEFAYDFELFGSYPPQYGMPGPSDPYPQHHGTPSGSSSSMTNEPQDFSSMFATPSPVPNNDVGRREHPERDLRPPNRYTPKTTPSNHQF
ncbi:hypothetical protein V6Z12_D10G199400 [Gossypium hirsutum]